MSEFFNENASVICKKCGGENRSDAKFCQNCGESLEKPPVEAEEVTATPWQQPPNNDNPYYQSSGSEYGYNSPPPYQPTESGVPDNSARNGLSIVSMVMGIVSLVCCYLTIPLSIAAIVTGIIALSKKYGGKGMAIAGIITSGVAILFYGALLIIFIIAGAQQGTMEWFEYY